MPLNMSPAEREEFLAAVHVAVLSVASPDGGGPLTVPVWYTYRPGGTVNVSTGRDTRKARAIRAAGRFSLCAAAMPRIAPSRPSAAVVAAVIVRRVVLLAPVAVSVRRSRAVSLRIRPTEAASTPNAITMPSAVAPPANPPRPGVSDLVSVITP
jgi:hypothetical protein